MSHLIADHEWEEYQALKRAAHPPRPEPETLAEVPEGEFEEDLEPEAVPRKRGKRA